MRITESLSLALKNIVSSKVRTLLTMLGIIIGVAAVIVIVGLGSGLEHYIADSFSSMGTNTLTVTVQSRGATRTMEVEDMYGIVAEHPQELELCSPTVSMMGGVKIGSKSTSTSASGVSEDYNSIYGYTVAQGRGLQYSDIATRAKVCVVGAYVNQAYFGGNALGQTLRVGGQSLAIVGVMDQREDSMSEGGSDDCSTCPTPPPPAWGAAGCPAMWSPWWTRTAWPRARPPWSGRWPSFSAATTTTISSPCLSWWTP